MAFSVGLAFALGAGRTAHAAAALGALLSQRVSQI
jgi:hypothetical protein